jgi:arginine-tRNA-protein transferase
VRLQRKSLKASQKLTIADPESYTWDPLDGELTAKLNTRPYVSLSRDRATTATSGTEANAADNAEAEAEINDEEVSLFALHMPGVLTVDEVKKLDLGSWPLLIHGSFVHMSVSIGAFPPLLISL